MQRRAGTQNGKVKLFPADQGRDVGSALSGLRLLALPVGRSGWQVLVLCGALSLLVASLVVPGFFVSVSLLRLRRTRAPTPSVRHAQEIFTVLVIEQQVRVWDPVGLRWLTGLGARVFIVECDTVVPCRHP